MSGYLLLTGATGLLGRYLVRDLLEQGQRLAILVRGNQKETAQQRVESILQHWENQLDRGLPRPVILHGDLRETSLGLSAREQRWVTRHCSSIMHSAASLAFHEESDGEPWRTNLSGTEHLLELCRGCNIRKLHYISTAYVCGLRTGTIMESELHCDQEFRNDYERSKFQAELMVREADCIDRLTVYRPAVIAGDSKTGYTNTYHGIYLYLRLMALLVPRHPVNADGVRVTKLRMPMTGYERRNVIPVDWTSQVIARLFRSKEAHGHTFHLAPVEALTPREVTLAGYSYFNHTGVEYIGDRTIDPRTYNDFEAQFLSGLDMYSNYTSTDPTFDCSNVNRFAADLPCPKIDEAMLHRYIRFGEKDHWGKRRPKLPRLDASVATYFESLPEADDVLYKTSRARVAIDVIGPGGAQCTLVLMSDGNLSKRSGLLDDSDLQLRISASEFHRLFLTESVSTSRHIVQELFPISLMGSANESNGADEKELVG